MQAEAARQAKKLQAEASSRGNAQPETAQAQTPNYLANGLALVCGAGLLLYFAQKQGYLAADASAADQVAAPPAEPKADADAAAD